VNYQEIPCEDCGAAVRIPLHPHKEQTCPQCGAVVYEPMA